MHLVRRLVILISVAVVPVAVAAQGLDTAKIDQALGRPGQKIGEVYNFGFPRTDLHVSVGGLAIKPGLVLGRLSKARTTRPWSWGIWCCWRMS